jgi:hydrogenase expression/formation protein HypE
MSTERIQLAHGGGGLLTHALIEQHILPRFGNGPLAGLPDSAVLDAPLGRMAFTTDSFVVQPLRFPGGNIGHLAVHGTVNDLAVAGASPRWISLAMILEEGLPLATLDEVLDAVAAAASNCGVVVATGDTKVVPHGLCDGLYLTTSGIGQLLDGFSLSPANLRPGDVVIASGTLADHGFAVMAARSNLDLRHGPISDTAPVHELVQLIQPLAHGIRCMRDPTRGGAATILSEIADASSCAIRLDEASLPLARTTRVVAELLGMDPLHVASEGRVLLVCAPDVAEAVLTAWRRNPAGRDACIIGRVEPGPSRLLLDTLVGSQRLVTVPRGDLLPRIC